MIDPFGAMPGQASRIEGLGGDEPATEPGYVFAVRPVAVRPGRAAIALTFHDLHASGGSISIDLTAVPGGRNSAPARILTRVVSLSDLMANDGRASIDFVAHRATLYAASGTIHGDHVVRASDIDVQLLEDLPATAATTIDGGADLEPATGAAPLRLTSIDEPSFLNPVSQAMTDEQVRHRDCEHWRHELRLGTADPAALWSQAFVLQALDRYDALEGATRGMGINVGDQSVPAWLAAHGCAVTILEQEAPDDRLAIASRLSRPAICPPERFDAALTIERMDLLAPEIRAGDVDFAWSAYIGGAAAFEDLFWLGAHAVRAGGMYVHVFAYDPRDGGDPRFPGRARIERLALNALSFGHDIAELKFRLPARDRAKDENMPFALILRHA